MSLFPSISVPLPFPLGIKTSYVFSFPVVFFYLVITGLIFYISLLSENSINLLPILLRAGGGELMKNIFFLEYFTVFYVQASTGWTLRFFKRVEKSKQKKHRL